MPIEIGDRVLELGMIWTHVDVEEIGETETKVFYKCNSCGYCFEVYLGD